MAANNQGNAPAAAEREQKSLESSMDNLSQRLTTLRGSITSLIAKVENDPNLNWASFLDSFALISGQMNSLMKCVKSESQKTPPVVYKKYITLPLFLCPDRDEELAKLTEGRVGAFSHDAVPHLLRTKPDPEVEARYSAYENRANSLAVDTVSKQLSVLDKITRETLKVINRERDDMDQKANARNEMEKTTSIEDTFALVAAVTHGKGLRGIPMQGMTPIGGPPGMMMNRPPMGQGPPGPIPGKVQSAIKTNIKAGAQVHPYQRS
jgi:mediator of RNA polymerase II transcription subunit 8